MLRNFVCLLALVCFAGCEQQSPTTDESPTNENAEQATSTTEQDEYGSESTTNQDNQAGMTTEQSDQDPLEANQPAKPSSPSATTASEQSAVQAVCNLEPIGDSGVTGTIRFTQRGETVEIRGDITGLSQGKHGFHVHESGDLSDKETGKSAGGHFNPTNEPHGRPSDEARHVGDLGNIEANSEGKASVDIEDDVIQLSGENSIVGKALVVHAQADQFTQPTGNAGDRVAFGVIERTDQ